MSGERAPFRVLTWNMDHWRRSPEQRTAAWERLRVLAQGGAALLQECCPPTRPLYPTVYREIGRTRAWGTAITSFALDAPLTEITHALTPYSHHRLPVSGTVPGALAVAQVGLAGVEPITLVSAYGLIDVYSQTTMLRIVADLIPLFDSADGRRVVLGGDFNVGTDAVGEHLERYDAILHVVRALGLVNLYESVQDRPERPSACRCGAPDCRHLTTRDGGGNFDYLFATASLAQACRRIVRLDDPETRELSDHWPIAAEFELPLNAPSQGR